eukprot:s2444_g2.t1
MSHDCPSGEGACALTVRVVSLPRDVSQVLNSSNSARAPRCGRCVDEDAGALWHLRGRLLASLLQARGKESGGFCQPSACCRLQAPANAAYDAWHRNNSRFSWRLPVVWSKRSLAPADKDYWLTLAAGLQVLGFTMLALDTSSSAAEGLSEKTLWAFIIAHVTRISTTVWGEGYIPEDNTGDVFLYQGLEVLGVLVVTFQVMRLSAVRSSQDVGQGIERWSQLIGMRSLPAMCTRDLMPPNACSGMRECGTRGKHMGLQEKELARCYASYRQLSQQACERLGVLAAILAFFTKSTGHDDYWADISWMFSTWMEAFALGPQVYLLVTGACAVDESAAHFAGLTLASSVVFTAFWGRVTRDRYREFDQDGDHTFFHAILTACFIRVALCTTYVYLFTKQTKRRPEYELCAHDELIERFCTADVVETPQFHRLPAGISMDNVHWIPGSDDWHQRVEQLIDVLRETPRKRTLIFVNSLHNCHVLLHFFRDNGWPVVSFMKGPRGRMGL